VKKVIWLGNSRKRLKDFPLAARRVLGQELLKVQLGGQPVDWRAMPIIGTGSIEIRIHSPQEYRLIYVASYPKAVYVLHCFAKKTKVQV
jgi:phage-related protein